MISRIVIVILIYYLHKYIDLIYKGKYEKVNSHVKTQTVSRWLPKVAGFLQVLHFPLATHSFQ
jgi:hypothetical protein